MKYIIAIIVGCVTGIIITTLMTTSILPLFFGRNTYLFKNILSTTSVYLSGVITADTASTISIDKATFRGSPFRYPVTFAYNKKTLWYTRYISGTNNTLTNAMVKYTPSVIPTPKARVMIIADMQASKRDMPLAQIIVIEKHIKP